VSWSAIAQIESGRRTDVRLKTLSALAKALGVSVDYLIGTRGTSKLFEHRILMYGSDEEFAEAAMPFFDEGIEQSHCLLAVATEAKIGLLRDALDDRSGHVEFADWADWYRSPQLAMRRYGAFVAQKHEEGAAWIRVMAEAAWTDHPDVDMDAWARYESLVNLAFASSPATIICTYDERSLPMDVVTEARRTHPEITQGGEVTASPLYREPEEFLLEPPTVQVPG
jgi:transcriptional regulator with XRE-family HTH domain